MASLGKWISMRFGIYFDAAYRADPNYRPAPNVVKNLVLPDTWSVADQCHYDTTSGAPDGSESSDWQWPANRYDGPGQHMDAVFLNVDLDPATGNPIDTMGYPRRIVSNCPCRQSPRCQHLAATSVAPARGTT